MLINHLPEILKKKEYSIRRLARESGINYKSVQALYHLHRGGVQFRILEAICAALDIQPGDLFTYQADPPTTK